MYTCNFQVQYYKIKLPAQWSEYSEYYVLGAFYDCKSLYIRGDLNCTIFRVNIGIAN